MNENGLTTLVSAHTNLTLTGKNIKVNMGLNGQLFTLNNNYTVEPRVNATYQLSMKNSLSFGYGLHSRLEPLQIYFMKDMSSNILRTNENLGFTKAHHLVLGYDWNVTKKLHLKIEPYYQILYDVPIALDSNESLLNLRQNWFVSDLFSNTGKGRNYGFDLTLEQFLDNGFYYLISGSIFNSEYKTNTSDWFNTRFNKNYLLNALAGKEFEIGNKNQNTLGINIRVSMQGGDRFSKIDEVASRNIEDVVYNEAIPFTEQAEPSIVVHSTINYNWNRPKTSHSISFKILNATNSKVFQGHLYNIKNQQIDVYMEAFMIPNLSYKISF